MLGEFEYLLLTAAARLGDDAYGVAIRAEVRDATGRECSLGALYTTIDRLERKGLLSTWMGDPTPQRGNHRLQRGGKGPPRPTKEFAMSLFASPRFLSRVMAADAVSCAATGALQLIFGTALARWTGLPAPLLLATGVFLP